MECSVHGIAAVIREPEVTHIGNGKNSVAKTTIVFEKNYKVDNEWQSDKCYLKVEAWGGLGENFAKSVKPGNEIYVDGTLHLNQWKNNDGTKRSEHILRMNRFSLLAPKKSAQSDDNGSSNVNRPTSKKTSATKPATTPVAATTSPSDVDDGIPF